MKKNKKRGIAIPIKTIITALLILLQLVLITVFPLYFSKTAVWFYTFTELLALYFVINIVNSSTNPSYKIAWIVFILITPVVGVTVFLLFGGGRVFPHLKKRMKKCEDKYMSYLNNCTDTQNKLIYADMLHSRQASYLTNESGFPVYNGTSAEYLESGEMFFERLLEKLNLAQKYIYIEFFILAQGEMWDAICQILKYKVSRGVEVKIIFDDFGSIGRQNKNFVTDLENSGIAVSVFNPIRPSVDIFMNNRNHRKIVIIDGEIAFTGGINIGDEYINRLKRFGHWQDSGIMLEGAATDSFTVMFCSMWEFTTGEEIDISEHLCQNKRANDGFVLPYSDGPLNEKNPAEGLYMQIINNAQRYVYITSPYLIIDNTMKTALCLASKSGIYVRIITPYHPDKWYIHPVTQYNYRDLLKAGVKIYEYRPGFIHSKLFLSDDIIATVGTVNMDYRSFYFHFECGVWMSENSEIKNIRRQFSSLFEKSKEITLEKWSKRPLCLKIKQSILHLFSPFM